jgi:hypothetical protein
MKKLFTTITVVLSITFLQAQTSNAELLAERIAQKMRDSLSLTTFQTNAIYGINIQISAKKQEVRQQFSNQDSIRIKTQAIENTRDDLYLPVLSEQQYALYKQKKSVLISAR